MAQQQGRSILAMIFRNFIQSLKPRKIRGDLVGTDYFGNRYFEIPANPQIGKRKPSRWFEPKVKEDFDQEIPAEWEAWLRGRRSIPPEEEEVLRNLAAMKQKKENAKEIALRETSANEQNILEQEIKGMESFPKHDEYETMPGKGQEKK
ncbi:mimitin, mitochondrial [Zootermopsis nevadensis]|uniref:Mimitin, mitochondrial n=1 Tax=Zootermopsis nevadensis TaxID=136037 RepID=A0A067R041_ZOONE|nr:mimitin, mitochondrial [Zootermopsis nevadensis]XP_021935757.1 mimitin, mitochondrial [Zootermopsis nevadensis]KDR10793.1 Mimitin, mitochondrial [Zootermopsis nevadensis]